ncbi:MAG: hypothetical protein H6923_10660 [Alphaproteobacteria bacterium]|nr:hypothetical protein [Alphaproteobacteria bacterium]
MALINALLNVLGTMLRLGRNPDGTGGLRTSHLVIACAVALALSPYLDTSKMKADADKLATFTAGYSDDAEAAGQWVAGATATMLATISTILKPKDEEQS